VVQQELLMLSASQEIYSQRVRLVFQNRGKLFEFQYRGWFLRLLINIDRVWRVARGRESQDRPELSPGALPVIQVSRAGCELCHEGQSPFLDFGFHD
jgi:hypothetical protein